MSVNKAQLVQQSTGQKELIEQLELNSLQSSLVELKDPHKAKPHSLAGADAVSSQNDPAAGVTPDAPAASGSSTDPAPSGESGDPWDDYKSGAIGFSLYVVRILMMFGMSPAERALQDIADQSKEIDGITGDSTSFNDFMAWLKSMRSATGTTATDADMESHIKDLIAKFKSFVDWDKNYQDDPKNPIPAEINVFYKDDSGNWVTEKITNPFFQKDGHYSDLRLFEYASWKASLDSNYTAATITNPSDPTATPVSGWIIPDKSAIQPATYGDDGADGKLWNPSAAGDNTLAGLYDPTQDGLLISFKSLYGDLKDFQAQGSKAGASAYTTNVVDQIEQYSDAPGADNTKVLQTLKAAFTDASADSEINDDPNNKSGTHPRGIDTGLNDGSGVSSMANTQTSSITQDEQKQTTTISGLDNTGQQILQTIAQMIETLMNNARQGVS